MSLMNFVDPSEYQKYPLAVKTTLLVLLHCHL